MEANYEHISVDGMDNFKSNVLLALAWLGTGVSFLITHWNAFLSTGAVLAAILASIYSALSSRAKKKFYEAETKKLNEGAPVPIKRIDPE
jgi:hypothetical protein